MQVNVTDRNELLSSEGRELAATRLRDALSRFSAQISNATLVVEDVNGPRGGVDKQCRITVQTRRFGTLSVTSQDASAGKCIAMAVTRLSRTLQRRVSKNRRTRRVLVH